jgi:signal transduction histidine kinase
LFIQTVVSICGRSRNSITRLPFQDEGFGIGLSYVKRVCEWHKWKVEAKNNEEKGITITIQINKNDYE